MGVERGSTGSWWGNWREREHLGDIGLEVWIILGLMSRRWNVGMWYVNWIGLAHVRDR